MCPVEEKRLGITVLGQYGNTVILSRMIILLIIRNNINYILVISNTSPFHRDKRVLGNTN